MGGRMTLKELRGMGRMNQVHFARARAARRELERKRKARLLPRAEETEAVDVALEMNEDHFRYGEELLDAGRIKGDDE